MENKKKFKQVKLHKGMNGIGEPLRDVSKSINEMTLEELYSLELTEKRSYLAMDRMHEILNSVKDNMNVEEIQRLLALGCCLDYKIKCLMFDEEEKIKVLKAGLDFFAAKVKNELMMLLVTGDTFALDYDLGLGRLLHMDITEEDIKMTMKVISSGKTMWQYAKRELTIKGDMKDIYDMFFEFDSVADALSDGILTRVHEKLNEIFWRWGMLDD